MRRIPIRVKVAAALAGPLVLLLGVTGYEVARTTRQADEVRSQVTLAEASVGPAGLFNALQDERNRAAVDLVGLGDTIGLPVKDNAAARAVTDDALAGFHGVIDGSSAEVRAAYAPAFQALDRLDELRAAVDAYPEPFTIGGHADDADEVFDRYSTIVDALLTSNSHVALAIDDPDLRRGADISFVASQQADVIARLIRHALVTAIRPDGFANRDAVAELGRLYGLAVVGERTMQNLATGEYAAIAKPVHDASPPFYMAVERTFETGQLGADFGPAIDTGPDESYDGPFRDRVKAILDRTAERLEQRANRRVRNYRLFALAMLASAGAATWFVSRSITRPLRAMTDQATRMAHQRLPEAVLHVLDTPLGDDVVVPQVAPVDVATRDEVADVARALNTVQDSALELAVEQAVLRRNIADSFVNLGRRNQNLLGRQIDFITQLERGETDPDTLANLFRLDHLATRMRRNAESLLVLAGVDPPRKWAAPVRITDTIRAALSEVEDYQRVAVRSVEPVTIMGSAAADLAHLLAELIENALLFSPADRPVEVLGRADPPGYALAVVDHGVGMSIDDLTRANRRLAGAESFTIAPSKYLGHYVAGNLAARHGIRVALCPSPDDGDHRRFGAGHGITAAVDVPPEVLGPTQPGEHTTGMASKVSLR